MTSKRIAQGLGWFSIALGLLEITMARRLARGLGSRDLDWVLRAYGAREIATGVGLLASRNRAPWMWGRVAGDALDIATLAAAMPGSQRKRNVGIALGAVAGVTALDAACAMDFAAQRRARTPTHDYSGRSGFPRPPEAMRGAARRPRQAEAPTMAVR
jgi:hypothetical protein